MAKRFNINLMRVGYKQRLKLTAVEASCRIYTAKTLGSGGLRVHVILVRFERAFIEGLRRRLASGCAALSRSGEIVNMSTLLVRIVVFLSIFLGLSAVAKETVIDHGGGGKTTVKSNKEGSTIERGGSRETTREPHKEAVERVIRESRDRGEKAVKQK